MLKSLKTQIVLTSLLCLALGVLAITLTNYFTARERAYQGLAEPGARKEPCQGSLRMGSVQTQPGASRDPGPGTLQIVAYAA